jgi:beta-lactamase regulating signal transducer with metallopeptidase domain
MEASILRQFISTGPAELLIASIWQGLLLTGFAWAALKLAPRVALSLRASTRFTLWLIVFTLIAVLPAFALGRTLFSTHTENLSAFALPQAASLLRINIAWAFALEGLWVVTSLFSLARLWISGRQMTNLLRTSTAVPFPSLDKEIKSIVTRTRLRPVEIRLSDAMDAPSIIGFFRPAIIVPQALWNELAPEDLKQVILHEMAHLDRGDDWTNLLQKLLRALCPLNPALFWAERHLCMEREQACDDAVLDAAGNARAYATCLTKLAENRLVRRAALLAPGLWKRHSELASRVENILHRRRRLGPMFSRGLVAASLVASLSGVLALQLCPRVVTFASAESLSADAVPQRTAETGSFGRTYPARYQDRQQLRFQEAVFHPQMNVGLTNVAKTTERPAKQVVRASVQTKAHAAPDLRSYGQLRLLELRSTEDDNGAVMTWILFTVEVPRNSQISHRGLDPSTLPTISTPDNWIVFQI